MKVFMAHCRKETKCSFCEQLIPVAEPMVVGRAAMKKREGWSVVLHWHPQCWIDQGMQYLEAHPYVSAQKGKKKLDLSLEDRKNRFRIQRNRASVIQKLKAIMNKEELGERDLDRIVKFSERLDELKAEIEPFGGVPKKW